MAKTRTSFKKGEGGRPRGVLNRTTKEAQKLFIEIMDGQIDRIEEALNNIDDDEKYLNTLSKLFQYYMPRKTDLTSDGEKIVPMMPTVVIKTKKSGS